MNSLKCIFFYDDNLISSVSIKDTGNQFIIFLNFLSVVYIKKPWKKTKKKNILLNFVSVSNIYIQNIYSLILASVKFYSSPYHGNKKTYPYYQLCECFYVFMLNKKTYP